MIKHTFILLFTIFFSANSFGQSLGIYYVSISIDSTRGDRLKFLSDSTVEVSTLPQHMARSQKAVFNYTKTDTIFKIFPEPVINEDIHETGLYLTTPLLARQINLIKIKGGFIDYDRSLIYVRKKYLPENRDLIYIIDGKTFTQDRGESNYLGIVTKNPKRNKALQNKLKGVNIKTCTLEYVTGLDAYKRFGIKKVSGVYVITSN